MVEIRPFLPDLLYRQLRDRDVHGIGQTVDKVRGRADAWMQLLGGIRRYAAHHRPEPGETSAVTVIDAATDLALAYDKGPSEPFLRAVIEYLMKLRTAEPRLELFELPSATEPAEVVPVSLLEDALAEADLERSCRTIARLRMAIQSREYLLELLLDGVAPEETKEGRLLVLTSATVKILHGMQGEAGEDLLFHLCAVLSEQPVAPAPPLTAAPGPVPCRAGYMASLDRDEPESVWLYLAHAFQAQRYAQVRQKGVRWGLRAWLVERLFAGREQQMDREEQDLGPPPPKSTGELARKIPSEIGEQISASVAEGSCGATEIAIDQLTQAEDVEPLFRWFAEGAVPALASGDPQPLLAINAARWGCHLLGTERAGRLIERLLERNAALHASAGGPE